MIRTSKRFKYQTDYDNIVQEAISKVQKNNSNRTITKNKHNYQNYRYKENINDQNNTKLQHKPNINYQSKTYKQLTNLNDSLSLDLDQFQQIKFISKQCSTIKQKQVLDTQQVQLTSLQEFNSLFQKANSKNQSQNPKIKNINHQQHQNEGQFFKTNRYTTIKDQKIVGKIRNIKNNQVKNKQILQKQIDDTKIKGQIKSIFMSLDTKKSKQISKCNCNNDILTSQMIILIGTIITKIKTKSKIYKLYQFQKQFMDLISDFDKNQLAEIFEKNKQKRQFELIKDNSEQQQLNGQIQQIQIQKKLNKISQKVNKYFSKNQISQKYNISKNKDQLKSDNFPQKQTNKQDQKTLLLMIQIQKRAQNYRNKMTNLQQTNLLENSQNISGIRGQFQLSFQQLKKHI